GCTVRIAEIDNDVAGHLRQQFDRVGGVLATRSAEVEDDGSAIALSQFISEGIEDRFALRRESAKDQHDLGGDSVDHTADVLVVQQQVNELRDLDVISGDIRFTLSSYD